jgi:5-(carboxyamino)imidazole ribonucleotide synthase
MTVSTILPGSQLGVLGGGQLGSMFATAARRLGYRVAVWDPDPEAPALRFADLPVCGAFEDQSLLERFAAETSAVTFEWENVSPVLAEALEQRMPVRPAARILRLLQNRLHQKRFLAEHGFPVAPFRAFASQADLATVKELGFPSFCKTATSGYDGKGQWHIASAKELEALLAQMDEEARVRHAGPPLEGLAADRYSKSCIVEQFLSFEKELSVLVVRGSGSERTSYPVVENRHEAGILRSTRVPADIEARTADQAAGLAGSIIDAMDGVGVFCVELFLMPGGQLLVNEVAPRPHNSGHYTLDACTVSQFEQQVRAVCQLPLGEVRLLSAAVMVNLLGDDIGGITGGSAVEELLAVPGACLHLYGKRTVRPRRKMGHVTFLAGKSDQAWASASSLLSRLGQVSDRARL